jgi:hypothetical protein
MTTEEFVAGLTADKLRSVYSGKAGECCCGCSGAHTYNSKHVAEAGQDRGYEVTPDEVNDTVVERVLRKLQREYPTAKERTLRTSFVSVDVGSRVHILYLTHAATADLVAQLPAEALGGQRDVDLWRAWAKENLAAWDGMSVEEIHKELGRGEGT